MANSRTLDSLINKTEFSGYIDVMYAHADVTEDIDRTNLLAGYEPYGFSINRAGIIAGGNISKKTSWEIELGLDSLSLRARDLYVNHTFHDVFQLRFGRMKVPGAYEMFSDDSFLSDTTMWMYDRSHAANRWAYASFLGLDARTVGIGFYGELLEGKIAYSCLFGNPDGVGMFLPRQNSLSYSHPNNAYSGWARIDIAPIKQIKFGGFIGDGKGRRYSDSLLVKLITYGGNFCAQSDGWKAMYEFTRAKTHDKYNPHYALGHMAMLSYRWRFIEAVLRYSIQMPNKGIADEYGVEEYDVAAYGLNLYINNSFVFKANYFDRIEYSAISEDLYLNNLFVLSVGGRF